MARRSTKLLRFENSLYNYDQKDHTWAIQPINIQNDKTKFDLFDSGTHSVCKRMSQKVNPINFFFNDLTPSQYEEVIRIASIENQALGSTY